MKTAHSVEPGSMAISSSEAPVMRHRSGWPQSSVTSYPGADGSTLVMTPRSRLRADVPAGSWWARIMSDARIPTATCSPSGPALRCSSGRFVQRRFDAQAAPDADHGPVLGIAALNRKIKQVLYAHKTGDAPLTWLAQHFQRPAPGYRLPFVNYLDRVCHSQDLFPVVGDQHHRNGRTGPGWTVAPAARPGAVPRPLRRMAHPIAKHPVRAPAPARWLLSVAGPRTARPDCALRARRVAVCSPVHAPVPRPRAWPICGDRRRYFGPRSSGEKDGIAGRGIQFAAGGPAPTSRWHRP